MESPITRESGTAESATDERSLGRDGLGGLRHLRDRVQAVVVEIDRLRAENRELAARVAALHGQPPAAANGAVLAGGDDLREKLNGYIAAIDHALREAGGGKSPAS
jgi:hypothetical protein